MLKSQHFSEIWSRTRKRRISVQKASTPCSCPEIFVEDAKASFWRESVLPNCWGRESVPLACRKRPHPELRHFGRESVLRSRKRPVPFCRGRESVLLSRKRPWSCTAIFWILFRALGVYSNYFNRFPWFIKPCLWSEYIIIEGCTIWNVCVSTFV